MSCDLGHPKKVISLLIAVVVLVAGCGEGKKDPGVAGLGGAVKNNPSSSPLAALDSKDVEPKFAQYMRQNGIPVADPKEYGGMMIQADENMDKAKMEKAMKTCQHLMQESGPGEAAKDPKIHDAPGKYATLLPSPGPQK